MTKAFDLVKHSLLFRKLIKAGLSLIFVRMLLFIYVMQSANVKWNGEVSAMFSLASGVRQGGVISAILYRFYVNDLFGFCDNGQLVVGWMEISTESWDTVTTTSC